MAGSLLATPLESLDEGRLLSGPSAPTQSRPSPHAFADVNQFGGFEPQIPPHGASSKLRLTASEVFADRQKSENLQVWEEGHPRKPQGLRTERFDLASTLVYPKSLRSTTRVVDGPLIVLSHQSR